ncbi:MAG: class I SAM-dependent methyltransferase [Phycisphaerales bacterium]
MDAQFWNERYGQSAYIYGTEPNTFLKNSVGHFPEASGGAGALTTPLIRVRRGDLRSVMSAGVGDPRRARVLCLQEGEGRNALFLAKRGYAVCGIDLSEAGRDKAMKLAAEHGVSFEYIVTDVNDFDFGIETWDAVVSISAHTDPATRQRVCEKTLRGLKPGGVFLLEAYHPNQLNYDTGGPKDIGWLVTLDDLRQHFPAEGILHQAELEREVSEGAYHTGKAFVTQFIFKKAPS